MSRCWARRPPSQNRLTPSKTSLRFQQRRSPSVALSRSSWPASRHDPGEVGRAGQPSLLFSSLLFSSLQLLLSFRPGAPHLPLPLRSPERERIFACWRTNPPEPVHFWDALVAQGIEQAPSKRNHLKR